MRKYVLFLLFSFYLLIVPSQILSSNIPTKTLTNRLTRISLVFESSFPPITSSPSFVLPPHAKTVRQQIKTEFKDRYINTFDVDVFFEKEGTYDIGPFVFYDKGGGSYSVSPFKIEVSSSEMIRADKSGYSASFVPPKIHVHRPHEHIFPFVPVYLVFEIPASFSLLKISWPGWKDVFCEKIDERYAGDGLYQIRYFLVFFKPGNYMLSPVQIQFNKTGRDYYFSSGAGSLNFLVRTLPKTGSGETVNTGEYAAFAMPSIAPQGDVVNIDILFSGKGYLKSIRPPFIVVDPPVDIFLKNFSESYSAFLPEPDGKVLFSYYFTPPDDAVYKIEVKPSLVFSPRLMIFKNISGYSSALQIKLPGDSAVKLSDRDFRKNLQIVSRPDYEFYIIFSGVAFITILSVFLFFRFRYRMAKEKRIQTIKEEVDPLEFLHRNVLLYIGLFSGKNVVTLSFSAIKECVELTDIAPDLKKDLLDWLKDMLKFRYLNKEDVPGKSHLVDRGTVLLHKLKSEKDRLNA